MNNNIGSLLFWGNFVKWSFECEIELNYKKVNPEHAGCHQHTAVVKTMSVDEILSGGNMKKNVSAQPDMWGSLKDRSMQRFTRKRERGEKKGGVSENSDNNFSLKH